MVVVLENVILHNIYRYQYDITLKSINLILLLMKIISINTNRYQLYTIYKRSYEQIILKMINIIPLLNFLR